MRLLGAVKIKPEEKLSRSLIKKGKTVALAESCTGGLAASRVTDIPGSSEYFKGGVVAYSNSLKTSLLGVSPSTIKKYGAVSEMTAREMARGVRTLAKSDFGAAVTGIAGPSGARPGKPLGLAYIAFSGKGNVISKKIMRKGDRPLLKKKFADALLELIAKNI